MEMLNAIEEQLTAIRTTAMEQSNRVANELNSAVDTINAQLARFNTTMLNVKQLRDKADELQAAALRDFDSAIANNMAVQVGIVQQIADGRMVTGSDTPVVPGRKPKLLKTVGGVS